MRRVNLVLVALTLGACGGRVSGFMGAGASLTPLRASVRRMAFPGGEGGWGPTEKQSDRVEEPPQQQQQQPPASPQSVRDAMEKWMVRARIDASGRRGPVIVSQASTLPSLLAEFWQQVAKIVTSQRRLAKTQQMNQALMFVAPDCPELQEYDMFSLLTQHLSWNAREAGCLDFGSNQPINMMTYHPCFGNRPVPFHHALPFRHSPYPALSLNVAYQHGGRADELDPLPGISLEVQQQTQVPQKALPVKQERGLRQARQEETKWMHRARETLEAKYYSAAVERPVTSQLRRLREEAVGVPMGANDWLGRNRVSGSNPAVLDQTLRWSKWVGNLLELPIYEQVAMQFSWDACVEPSRVAQADSFMVARGSTAEEAMAEFWEALAFTCKEGHRVLDIGRSQEPKPPANGAELLGGPAPLFSSALILPDFNTFQAHIFQTFGTSLQNSLECLPLNENISIALFHPEEVDPGTEEDDLLRRAPYPTVHICFWGEKSKRNQL